MHVQACRRLRATVTKPGCLQTTSDHRVENVSGKWLRTSCKTSPKKTSPACLWMAPNSMTTTSMAPPNTPHEALLCRYVLLDCPVLRQGPVEWACHGLR